MSSKIVASVLAALVFFEAGAARAQSSASDAAIAQSLFDEARKLMNQKKFTEACPRLERSYKLDPAPGTLLNLAVCHEAVGRTATAWDEFRDSVTIARRENQPKRVRFAQQHIDALKNRICTITVRDAGQERGLEWHLDGAKMGTEALGIALPIDPGSHVIDAVAPGKRAWKTTVELQRDGETKTLEIPPLEALPVEAPPRPLEPVVVPVVVEKSHGPSAWTWVALGVGVVGYGALALGGIEALTEWNARTAACGIGGDPNACSQSGIDADKQARTWALVADIGLGVGVAGTIATVVLAITTRGKSKEHVALGPFVGPRAAGLSLGAVF